MNKKLKVLDSTAGADALPTQRPAYWHSMAELEQTPEFREAVEREFSEPLEQLPPSSPARRRFMEVMGASFAMAGLVGCRWREDKILPMTRRPEGVIPGTTQRYATAMELGGVAVGLHATSYDGRPIKIDGNPLHPDSLGAASVYHQASVLNVYDPDRSDSVTSKSGSKRQPSTFEALDKACKDQFKKLREKRGEGLRVLSERSSSPTLAALRERWNAAFPLSRWVVYEPLSNNGRAAGTALCFGKPHRVHYALEHARVVVTLDADIVDVATFPSALANARGLIKGRVPEATEMNRVYAIESTYSLTGGVADHRFALRSEQIKAVVAWLDAEISAKANPLPEQGASQPKPSAEFLNEPKLQRLLGALVKDLLANVGKSVIAAGLHQPAEVHAIVERLNVLLGNSGRTVFYTEDAEGAVSSDVAALKDLTAEMAAGKVDTLLILGGNPAYDAPSDVPFGAALDNVAFSVRVGLYEDETSQGASWHVPAAHYLESWGDARAYDGTISIVQPLIAPIYGGRSSIEVLARLLGEEPKALELVKAQHRGVLGDERRFRKAVHDGIIEGTAFDRVSPKLSPLAKVVLSEREAMGSVSNGQFELRFVPCSKVYDGRYANNAWLQELPEMFSRLSWDNAALLSVATAKSLGVTDGDVLTLTTSGKSVQLPCQLAPGLADGTIKVALGYGRTHAGRVGGQVGTDVAPVGGNTYLLRSSEAPFFAGGLNVSGNGPGRRLANTQDNFAMDQIGMDGINKRLPELVRERELAEFKKQPDFAKHEVHQPHNLNLWVDPVSYEGHKWGMAVDLNKCIGCSACVTACQAENNIPVVGQENTAMGREMLWLRIDRYYRGGENEPEVRFQPMPCQQCENAPCEQVCPVGATMHSAEGLNDMVYNRCIGTRYCSNNCPYKVRRFNYFNYNLDVIGITPYTPTDDPKMKVKSMVFNPEVTVRSRGVMEKCTFCVQRIQKVKIEANNVRRPIEDGEIRTACQETCPTDAIVFGDLNDQKSRVTALQKLPRSYELLGEFNNRPRVRYLARITNPNPELA
ncbi:MAG TPA: TAT-variant-translocated molybdopterin oxidoreductase [Polyangiaceae bacterium]|nr:TAT-variant-translocated molybdopterin oxidoreductase [Polyangiaceae bacterium]